MATFRELLQLSFKSEDTEEWLDVHFTRPIGLVFALLWNRLGIHPNAITILSIFLGIGAGWMFHFTDWLHNLYGHPADAGQLLRLYRWTDGAPHG